MKIVTLVILWISLLLPAALAQIEAEEMFTCLATLADPFNECGPARLSADNDALCLACCKRNHANARYLAGNWGVLSERFGLQCCCEVRNSLLDEVPVPYGPGKPQIAIWTKN